MGKHKKYSQLDLSRFVYDEYVFNNENIIDNSDIDRKLNLLVDSRLACKISGRADVYLGNFNIFNFICKKMTDWNPELHMFIKRKENESDYQMIMSNKADNSDVNKYSSYILEDGIYYALISNDKSDEFALLKVKDDGDFYYSYSFYFIGKKCFKKKNKFFKEFDKINTTINNNKKEEKINYTDGRGSKTVVFKSFDQMVFKDKEFVLKYIDNWKNNIPKYHEYGMIPKLSILLYGEPGTGKSTFCKALAKYLDIKSITSVSPDYFGKLDDGEFTSKHGMYKKGPSSYSSNNDTINQTIYSLDDIDCVGRSRDDDQSLTNAKITSSLLEYLDNPPNFYFKANDGKYYLVSIVCATTNYYDRLDPAVKRFGRFDLTLELSRFDKSQAEEMCSIYDLTLKDVYKDEIKKDTTFSPAQIQALCMENIDKSLKSQ